MAPRECDLIFFTDGGILKAHGAEEEASFFQGYGPWEPDPTATTYYRLARVMEDIVSFAAEACGEVATEERMEAVGYFERLFR